MGQRLGQREILLPEMQGLVHSRILYVAHDHLNISHGVLRTAYPESDLEDLRERAQVVLAGLEAGTI